MRKTLARLRKTVFATVCAAGVAASAFSYGSYASTVTARTTDYLNLRQGMGASTAVLLTLGKNVSVTVLDNSNANWAKVETQSGKTGYCSKQYLSFSSSSQTGSGTSAASSGGAMAAVLQNLNLRSGSSLSSGILLILSKGGTVKVLDNSNSSWAKVQTQSGVQGWCYKSYLKISGSPSQTSSGSSSQTSSGQTATTTDYLNLRSGAGTGYGVILTLGKGVTASVLDNSNSGWVRVGTQNGTQGWCSRQYLTISGSSSQPPASSAVSSSSAAVSSAASSSGSGTGGASSGQSGTGSGSSAVTGATVTADLLRLRQSADTSGAILANLPYGTVLKVLDTSVSGWIKVQTADGKTGYVSSQYVTLTYADGSTSGQTPSSNAAVSLSSSSQTVPQGKTLYLQASTNPSGAAVTWSSSNSSVASVSNGYVYAASEGTAQITASSGSGSAACSVTVTDAEPVRTAYASPNIAAPGQTVTFTAVTDASRDGVYFAITQADGSLAKVTAGSSQQVTTSGTVTKVWSGSTTFSTPGVYSFTAYSSENGVYSGTGFQSDTMVSTQSDYTVTTSETRRISDKMLSLIAKWEGYSASVYADQLASNSIATIGYGCTLGTNSQFYNNLSETEAWSQLVNKVNHSSYTTELNKMTANNGFLMSQNQADCLISFAYNVGSGYFNSSTESDFRRIMKNAVVPPSIPAGSDIDAAATEDTAVLSSCSESASVVSQITAGTQLQVTDYNFSDKKDGWYEVRLSNGQTGWVNSGYVNLSNSSQLVHDLNYTNAYAFGSELIRWNQAGGKFYSGLFYRRLGETNVYNYNDYDALRYNKYGYHYPNSASSLS